MVSIAARGACGTSRAASVTASMRRLVLVALVGMATSGCDAMSGRARHRGVPVVVGDSMLRYPDGSSADLGLTDIELLGQLAADNAPSFVIVAGRTCSDCDELPSVLVRSPRDGPVTSTETVRGSHPYPGRTVGDADGITRSVARVFRGECLPQRPAGVVSYRTDFGVPGDEPLREVRITEVHGDSLIDWRTIPEVRVLAATLLQVRARRCTEVAPRDMVTPP
jgi:hypothetical protein